MRKIINNMLDKLKITCVKQTTSAFTLERLGYADMIIKVGNIIFTYRTAKGEYRMIEYIKGITSYTILKEK